MLLCVNVSNSKITLGVFDGEDIILKTSVSATVGKTTTEYAVLFKSVFDLHPYPYRSCGQPGRHQWYAGLRCGRNQA